MIGNDTFRALLAFTVSWKEWKKAPWIDNTMNLELESFDILMNFQ